MVYKLEQNKNMKLTIPYYLHKAGAGFPTPATDYIEEDIDLNMHLIRNVPATFIIRVHRTQSSFELAGKRLGADVMSMNMGNSAIKKCETLIDTAMTLNAMHPEL